MANCKMYSSAWLLLAIATVIPWTSARSTRTKRQASGCVQPQNLQNGIFDCEMRSGDRYMVCTASCEQGFRFQNRVPSVKRRCELSTGRWDEDLSSVPLCVADESCPEPSAPAHGSIRCNMVNSDKVCSVYCDAGFVLSSPLSVNYSCSENGEWTPSRSLPDCVNGSVTAMSSVTPPTTASSARPLTTEATSCVTWGKNHYRTFDNRIYDFRGSCQYLLARDCLYQTFDIYVINDAGCVDNDLSKTNSSTCKRNIDVYLGPKTRIQLHTSNGVPVVTWSGETLHVPTSREGVVFEQVGGYLTVRTSIGVMVKWDANRSILVKVSDDFKGKTCGLCGRFDGNPENDFEDSTGQLKSHEDFTSSWKRTPHGEATCPDVSQEDLCKLDVPEIQTAAKKAAIMCRGLLSDPAFKACSSFVNPAPYLAACTKDCCVYDNQNCTCSTMEAYARACIDAGVIVNWRTQSRCPVQCSGGMVFQQCGSSCTQECGTSVGTCTDTTCIDGCFCPAGMLLHAGTCVAADQCPCVHADKEYRSGDSLQQDCNNCTCNASKWSCTNNKCSATCSAVGDPHFQTFDGKRYDFMGTCSYYMLYDKDYKVILDNQECGIGEASCAKSVTLELGDDVVMLDHNHQLFLNGREIKTLPAEVAGVKIFMVSSLFMQAELPNNVVILWDGRTRVYVKAPPSLLGRTQGLCGTFDNNQHNDFQTRDGDTETSVNAFGNKWKTAPSCRDVPLAPPPSPCDTNGQRMQRALSLCKALKSDLFKGCHSVEDVQSYYDNCMYDVCSCQGNIQDCLCPSVGQYADNCASQGVVIQWREQVTECKLPCPGLQQYQVCGNPCERTCRNMAEAGSTCSTHCVEGCNCPDGQALDNQGQCVPVSQCPCVFDGREFPPGYKALKGAQLCVCNMAKWNCSHLNYDTTALLPDDLQSLCQANMHYTDCVSPCPDTCDSLEAAPTCSADRLKCKPGCACNAGLVMNDGACVNMSMCPCHHGGKAFYQGDTITKDCNKCTCTNQRWECETKECPAVCSAVGDSHYTTYDGRDFQFQGTCDYVLTRARDGSATPFVVSVENVACGTSGVTCSKMATVSVGAPGSASFYSLRLVRGQSVALEPFSPFIVREIGLFLHVDTPYGLSLQWDHGTRLYVKLSSSLRGQVEGLCGNFNGDQKDDFTTPQGGPPAVKATTFGDSWKMHAYCAPAAEVVDTCEQAPQRKPWAQRKCGVLSSDVFRPCHAVEPYKKYLDRCVFDTCACDQGGDCECLCTSIAAYAHVCASKGVLIKWRSNDLCPIECEDCKTYNPCITSCPKKTCDNRLLHEQLLQQCYDAGTTCSEGCDLHPCPSGQVYDSLKEPSTCIPEVLCQTPACEVRGKLYREGERVWDDSVCNHQCEICNCRNGSIEHISFGYCTRVTPATPANVSVSLWTSTSRYSTATPTAMPTATSTATPTASPTVTSTATPTASPTATSTATPTATPTASPTATSTATPTATPTATSTAESSQSSSAAAFSSTPSSSSASPSPPPAVSTSAAWSPSISSTFTLPPVKCVDGWTSWMSASTPTLTNVGDVESFPALRVRYTFCQETEMDSIQCRLIGRDAPAQYAGQNVTCDLIDGLRCYHRDQNGQRCNDYEVRFFCRCVPASSTSSTSSSSMPEGSSGTFSVTSFTQPDSKGTTVSPSRATGISPEISTITPTPYDTKVPSYQTSTFQTPSGLPLVTCQSTSWTSWINNGHPSATGDLESLADLRKSHSICDEEFTKYIECRRVNASVSSDMEKVNVVCNTKAGFACLNSIQPPGSTCEDYEIRVFCDCSKILCQSDLISIASQEAVLRLTASSQIDAEHNASSAAFDSLASWTPASDSDPWLQVDLGYSRVLSGINTTGGATSWVTSYSLEVSSDCTTFRYLMNSDKKPEIFEGNTNSITVVSHMFRTREQNVRCVRVHPLQFSTAPSLRLTLLGCSETYETLPPDFSPSLPPLISVTPTQPGQTPIVTEGTPSTTPGSVAVTMPYSCAQGWTRYFSLDTPQMSHSYETSSPGDYEILSELRQYYSFCASPSAVKCRTVGTEIQAHMYSPQVTCDLGRGLVCVNALAPEGQCADFEISFYCDCGEETTAALVTVQQVSGGVTSGETVATRPTVSPSLIPTASPTLSSAGTEVVTGHTVQFTGTSRLSPDSPSTEVVTGHTLQFTGTGRLSPEPPGTTRENPTMSPTPFPTPTPSSQSTQKEEVSGYTLQFTGFGRLSTVFNEISTFTGFGTPSASEVTEMTSETMPVMGTDSQTTQSSQPTTGDTYTASLPLTGQPLTPVPYCMWSDWMNFDHRTATSSGDLETLSNLRMAHAFCEHPVDIECRVSDLGASEKRGRPYNLAGQLGVTCDLNRGLTCLDANQVNGEKCLDYEVRVYCVDGCASSSAVPAGHNLTTSLQGSEVSSSTTGQPSSTASLIQNFNQTTSSFSTSSQTSPFSPFPTCTPGWSPWLNTDSPSTGGGDVEIPASIPGYPATCRRVAAADCRVAGSERSYKSTGQSVTCDNNGLQCANNDRQVCMDYEVRFYCMCGPETSSASSFTTVQMFTEGSTPSTSVDNSTSSKLTSARTTEGSASPSPWASSSVTNTQSPSTASTVTPPEGPTLTGRENPNLSTTTNPLISSTAVVISTESGYTTTTKVCNERLGISDPNVIPKDQLTASTSKDYTTEADQGRLDNQPDGAREGSWVPRYQDQDQWIQVDLKRVELVTGVVVQGHPTSPYWVTLYSVSTSLDGINFTPYVQQGHNKTTYFVGSSDQNTQSQAHFDREIPARYVRLTPQAWNNGIALRFDLLSCTGATALTSVTTERMGQESSTNGGYSTLGGITSVTHSTQEPVTQPETPICSVPMGIDNPVRVSDSQLTASSTAGPNTRAYDGRLFNEHGAWVPQLSDENQWLQVDVGQSVPITGVLTQGSPDSGRWVTQYLLRYSNDSLVFITYTSPDGSPFQITANSDSKQVANVTIWPPVTARYWRLVPTKWSSEGIGLRFNLVGCLSQQYVSMTTGYTSTSLNVETSTGTARTTLEGSTSIRPDLVSTMKTSLDTVSSTVPTAVSTSNATVCLIPMNLASRYVIQPEQLTSSSDLDPDHTAQSARLYSSDPSGKAGGWAPRNESSPWIQVDLLTLKLVSGIVTQGSPDLDRWVTSYIVTLSSDGVTFAPYSHNFSDSTPTTFVGNNDSVTPARNLFTRDVLARYVRLQPTGGSQRGFALRFEVLGCHPDPPRISYVPTSPSPSSTGVSTTTEKGANETYQSTSPTTILVCDMPMGVENPEVIQDYQLRASSCVDPEHCANRSRLYMLQDGPLGGGWQPSITETDSWIDIDFLAPYPVAGVITQGSAESSSWVTSYEVYTSTDGINFYPVTLSSFDDKKPFRFSGNSDQFTPVQNMFPRIAARYVRIRPVEFHGTVGLRFGIIGCQYPSPMPRLTTSQSSAQTGFTGQQFTVTEENKPTGELTSGSTTAMAGSSPTSTTRSSSFETSTSFGQRSSGGQTFPTSEITTGNAQPSGSTGFQGTGSSFQTTYPSSVTQIQFITGELVTKFGESRPPGELSTASTKSFTGFGTESTSSPVSFGTETVSPHTVSGVYPVTGESTMTSRAGITGEMKTGPTNASPGMGAESTSTTTAAETATQSSLVYITGQRVTNAGWSSPQGELSTGSTRSFTGYGTESTAQQTMSSSGASGISLVTGYFETMSGIGNATGATATGSTVAFTGYSPGSAMTTSPTQMSSSSTLSVTGYSKPACMYWSPWFSGQVPDALGEIESFKDMAKMMSVCQQEQVKDIQCRAVDSKMSVDSNEIGVSCDFPTLTLTCSNTNCLDYEIRVFCDECSEPTRISTFTTPQMQSCMNRWSAWVNRDTDPTDGDKDSLSPQELGFFCPLGRISRVECATADSSLPQSNVTQLAVSCDVAAGVTCDPRLNTVTACQDFKIRYQCECQGLSTAPPIVGSSTPASFSPCTQSGWSLWVNRDSPQTGDGDREYLTTQELSDLCTGGIINQVECETSSGVPYYMAGQIVDCSVHSGFTCLHRLNTATNCSDFQIRYYCQCTEYSLGTTEKVATPLSIGSTYTTMHLEQSSSSSTSESSSFRNIVSTTTPTSFDTSRPLTSGATSAATITHPMSSTSVQPDATKSTVQEVRLQSTESESHVTSGSTPSWLSSTSQTKANASSSPASLASSPAFLWTELSSSSTELPHQTSATVITRCSSTGWMQWVNKDIPQTGGGDYEFLSQDELANLCMGGNVTAIECYAGDTPASSTGEVNECTLENGLICKNDANSPAHPCSDYKVRYFCNCGATGTVSMPATTTTTYNTPTISIPQRIHLQCTWSPWLNADKPNSEPSDPGDVETIDLLKTVYGLCPDIAAVECRVAGSSTPATGVMCDANNGLRCYNKDQPGGICYDYEIRVLCWSSECQGSSEPAIINSTPGMTTYSWSSEQTSTVPCQAGYEWSACAFTCDQVCDYMARTSGACDGSNPDTCVAGCRPQDKKTGACPDGQRLLNSSTCVPPQMCTCQRPNGAVAVAFETWEHPTDPCTQCSCFDGAVRCLYDTFCAQATQMTGVSGEPATSSASSVTMTTPMRQTCGWSAWLNENSPLTGIGDVETVARAVAILGTCSAPISVQCREAKSGLRAEDLGQKITCSVTSGLTCYNTDNKERCRDYEMRVFCPCPTETSTLPLTLCPASHWSEWINNDSPDADGVDRERMTEAELKSFCVNGDVTDVRCQTITGLPSSTTGEVMTCTVQDGAVCKSEDNYPINCQDYMIQYYCNCSGANTGRTIYIDDVSTTPSSPRTSLSPVPSVCGWTDWMSSNMPASLGEQETIPDLRLHFQFCPTDDITAVECRDKSTQRVVTSDPGVVCDLRYSGLICRQELLQSKKCPDYEVRFLCEPKDKNCSGQVTVASTATVSTSAASLVTNYVTVTPTNHSEMTTGPTKEKTTPSKVSSSTPPPVKVCQDPMKDQTMLPVSKSQLKASSSLSRYTGPERSILDSQSQSPYTGGWIPAREDSSPWIRVNFPEPIEMTGVVTQGREEFPMWVTSYRLLYSLDGNRFYYYYGDVPGTPQIFSANSDSTSTVRQVLRPTTAQFVLIEPVTWEKSPALRFSIFGCRAQQPTSAPTPSGSSGSTIPEEVTPSSWYSMNYTSFSGRSFPTGEPLTVCTEDMGMLNGQIRDDMISASSSRDPAHVPSRARLSGPGSWMPDRIDKEQYIQVDLTEPRYVTGVTTQGRPDALLYVTSFRFLYSTDGVIWNVYRESGTDKVFAANSDTSTPVTHIFKQPIRARYVEINPLTWEGGIALRFEIHGCFEQYVTEKPPVTNNSTVLYVTGRSPVTEATPFPTIPGNCIVWHNWVDTSRPSFARPNDREALQDVISASGACKQPIDIQCRTAGPDHTPAQESGQRVRCTLWEGLVCQGAEQDLTLCFNYEARVACLRDTDECRSGMSSAPTATPTGQTTVTPISRTPLPCYMGLDTSSCPSSCDVGLFCNGRDCVPRSKCPCDVDGRKAILAGQVIKNDKCQTCQCLNGGLLCLSNTCSGCSVGVARLNSSCDCQCVTCSENEFQCGGGECLPADFRCNGVIDCLDDELNCTSAPTFTPPTVTPTPRAYTSTFDSSLPFTLSPTQRAQTTTLSPAPPITFSQTPEAQTTPQSPLPPRTMSPTPREPIVTVSPTPGEPTSTFEPSVPFTLSPTPRAQTTTLSPSPPITFSQTPEAQTTPQSPLPPKTMSPTPKEPTTTLSPTPPATFSPTPRSPTTTASPSLPPTMSQSESSSGISFTVNRYSTPRVYTQEDHPGTTIPTEFSTTTSRYSTREACQYVTCAPLVPPTLNPGYQARLVLDARGCCEQYEAVCQPLLCPQVESSCTSPRVVRPANNSDCCPVLDCVCPERCPATSELFCSEGAQIVEIAEDCNCTRKACLATPVTPTPQQVVCTYRSEEHTNVSVHSVNSVWNDGPCKTCRCLTHGDGMTEASCRVHVCPECKLGEESVPHEGQCCPECRPLGCVVDNTTYANGEALPSQQACYNRTCTLDTTRGLYVIRDTHVECKPLSDLPICADDVNKNAYSEDGCCMTCIPQPMLPNTTADACRPCSPRAKFSHMNDSVHYLRSTNTQGAQCTNTEPVLDMKECAGYCETRSAYLQNTNPTGSCTCCQPAMTTTRTVNLTCSDNSTMPYSYNVPEMCVCTTCAGS